MKYIALAIIILAIIVLITVLFFIGWWSSERMKSIRADRIERQKSADVMVVASNEETWIRDTNKSAEWHNLTGTPLLRVNGDDRLPSSLELKLHTQRLLARRASNQTIQQLPTEIEDDKPSSLFDLLKMYPHVMFIAGSGSGKTTMINHGIEWYLKQDSKAKIVWLSTHINLDRNKNNIHPKAVCIQQPAQIAKSLTDLLTTYQKRRDGAGQYPKLIIALDEWLETVAETNEWIKAGDILARMSSGARKTNISLILAGQSGGVIDLDIKGRSAIKYNFAEIQLSTRMKEQNKAIWLNGRERVEIDIPGPFYSIGDNRVIELPVEKSKEQQWLELVDGGMSKNEASLQVFDKKFAGTSFVNKLNSYISTSTTD